MVTVVDEISYIIDLMRTKGTFIVPDVNTYPSGDITICGNKCASITSLPDGEYKYYSNVPYFYFGTKKEILSRLVDKNKINSRTKYPAILLQMPIKEMEPDKNRTNATVDLFFVTPRVAGMTYSQSYEHNIKPILYPMVESFIDVIPRSESVFGYEVMEKIEAPNYGDDKIVATDYWDVIYLKLNLKLLVNCKKQILCQM